ncbi:unnamed protein product [Brugia pahangi]|uniref:Uncharacterized protein n=1 Tax=Brugia pahangi TaxID=6280 RepID=A0A0N4TKV9_BRUPA|nr:unnamed protein product [Brugia pahangi]
MVSANRLKTYKGNDVDTGKRRVLSGVNGPISQYGLLHGVDEMRNGGVRARLGGVRGKRNKRRRTSETTVTTLNDNSRIKKKREKNNNKKLNEERIESAVTNGTVLDGKRLGSKKSCHKLRSSENPNESDDTI